MNQYYIDRTKSGKVDFQKDFSGRSFAPRLATIAQQNMSLFIDVSSVELFADNGLTIMTALYFPNKTYDKITLQTPGNLRIKKLEYVQLKPTIKK